MVLGGWWLVVGGWWLVVGGWWLVGRLVLGGWLVCCSFFVVGGRLRATKLIRTTWYHHFEPDKEVVGSWWRQVVAWLVGCWLHGWAVGSKTMVFFRSFQVFGRPGQ